MSLDALQPVSFSVRHRFRTRYRHKRIRLKLSICHHRHTTNILIQSPIFGASEARTASRYFSRSA